MIHLNNEKKKFYNDGLNCNSKLNCDSRALVKEMRRLKNSQIK